MKQPVNGSFSAVDIYVWLNRIHNAKVTKRFLHDTMYVKIKKRGKNSCYSVAFCSCSCCFVFLLLSLFRVRTVNFGDLRRTTIIADFCAFPIPKLVRRFKISNGAGRPLGCGCGTFHYRFIGQRPKFGPAKRILIYCD